MAANKLDVILKASPTISSDHCALILKTQPLVRIKKDFRNRNNWNQFIRKKNRCKRELTEWSRRKFKRVDKEIEKKKIELQHIQESNIRVSELIRDGESWDANKIQEIFSGNIVELIFKTHINLINRRDHFVWLYRSDGQYSVRTGYHSAKEEKDAKEESKLSKASTSQNLREVWETLWTLPVPQKGVREGAEKNFVQLVMCMLVHMESEESTHIPAIKNHSRKKYLVVKFHNATKGINNEIRSRVGRCGKRKRITCRPPPNNWLKVNTDATFHKETGTATSTVVVKDWQEKIDSINIAAEAQAYREALFLIKNLQLGKYIIETDCLPLVQVIQAKVPMAEADAIIRDILQLLDKVSDVGTTWTLRDGNNLTCQLTAMATGNELQRQWIVNPPIQVRKTIRTEARFIAL
ncbi:hypothetical protein Ahy_A09g042086 [Arachis hypogaea]|uniref:RNase H type-1 domain-containing protein n=1 Tax=Arachis hypogaea TaxID=3818 RepID=A0A445BEP0_ARAHY|nr:hypothetical protein Ahy_A09g042086 [Arachis hypogaea]